ncbi:MFS general substrate transporter [Ramicandelaber brevisporus]|nr:MFS general substrate transporter [Ramicandelaber brevisporus]
MGQDTPCAANSANSGDGTPHAPLSVAEQTAFMRRISWRIFPLIFLAYMFVNIDKANISNGRIYDLEKDLGMAPGQFGWVVSAFFFGYMALMVPLTLLFRRTVRPSLWLAVIVLSSGCVATGMTFVQSFGSLLALRILLGVTESSFHPSMIFYLTNWFKRSEMARAYALFLSANPIGGIVKGFVAYAVGFIGKGADGQGWSPWRWLFLVEGLPTLAVGLVVLVMLPDYPGSTRQLTPRERHAAQSSWSRRTLYLEIGATSIFGANLLLFVMYFIHGVIITSFSTFLPTIIRAMGFGKLDTQLLTIPQSVLGLILVNVLAIVSDRSGRRARYSIACGVVATLSVAVLAILGDRSRWIRFALLTLVQPTASASLPILLAWGITINSHATVSRYRGAALEHARKARIAALTAMLSLAHSAGGIVAGQMFSDSEAPIFRRSMITSAALLGVSTLAVSVLFLRTRRTGTV